MKKRIGLAVLASLLVLTLLVVSGCGAASSGHSQQTAPLTVEVLDIGQGDAILIRAGGQVTLVDSGDVGTREKLVSYIKERGITAIDNVIITHPHADHMGGMAAIFENFTVKQIYDSGQTATSALYRNYLATINKKNIPFAVVHPGMKIDIGGGAALDILAPEKPLITGSHSDLNNNSIIAKLVFNQFTMLLPGDAEQEEEARAVQKYGNALQASVLKSGHHGSNTASSAAFLKAVHPEAVVISLGANNEYHHPHPSTLKKYENLKLQVYRTDLDGTVTIASDGQNYQITKGKK